MSKIALITGAGSGVGRAAATALAAAGWSLALTGRRADKLAETAALTGGDPLIHPADVSDPGQVEALFAAIKARFSRLDLLFNNAGTGAPPIPLEDLTPAQWRAVVDVNLSASFYCAQGAFRLMKDQAPRGGRIINNGSISADRPRPNSAPYTATKHAISGLTKSLSLDGRKYDIAAGQIDIGNADTEMMARAKNGLPQPDGSVRIEPTMEAGHVGEAIVYMANLPLSANVLFMTVMATQMPLVGRG